MTLPPSLLVRSGRRFGAGPGHLIPTVEGFGRRLLIALVAGACTALMVSPAVIAIFSTGLHLHIAPWLTRLTVMPVLEAGRLVTTVVLVAKVIVTQEPE
jgi:hypothetical protein